MRGLVKWVYGSHGMRCVYNSLAPARYQVRRGVFGDWYVLDTAPDTYSRIEGTRYMIKDDFRIIYNRNNEPWKLYGGAYRKAMALNKCSTDAPKTAVESQT